MLIVHVLDMEHYEDFINRIFRVNKNIKQFRSLVSIRRVKYTTEVPMDRRPSYLDSSRARLQGEATRGRVVTFQQRTNLPNSARCDSLIRNKAVAALEETYSEHA